MNMAHPTTKRPATYRDVLDAPPDMVAELFGGALHLQPRPRPKHSHTTLLLAWTLEADGTYLVDAALHDDAEVRLAPFAEIAVPLSALWP